MAMNTFCGANVVVEIEGFPLLETAGLTYSIQEGKMPIYGYSSRHFDAVARGQTIVQGSLIINYVHQDYLFRAIEKGLADSGLLGGSNVDDSRPFDTRQYENIYEADRMGTEILTNYAENAELAQGFKDEFWNTAPLNVVNTETKFPNPHDSFGGMDIRVTFGERLAVEGNVGDTGLLLSDVYFTGRSLPIQISEDVIVEEYPFFARNVSSLRRVNGASVLPGVNVGEETITTGSNYGVK